MISTEAQNFNVAFAFLDYDNFGDDSDFEQAEYGELKAFRKEWGKEGVQGTHFYPIETRPCTKADLGLDD